MPKAVIKVKWEWLANRTVDHKVLVLVQGLSKASKGILNIRTSPSMAAALPDATDVVGSVLLGPEQLVGKTLSVRMPGVESQRLKMGRYAALAMVGSDPVCVCVSALPENVEAEKWIESWVPENCEP